MPPDISPAELLTPTQFLEDRRNIFCNVESMRWFERRHGVELTERGAIFRINGRRLIHAENYDAVLLEVGRRGARA